MSIATTNGVHSTPTSIQHEMNRDALRDRAPNTPTKYAASEALRKRTKPHKASASSNHETSGHLLSVEEGRRSRDYDRLVCVQRRYAEKLSTPSGSEFRFTKEEWDTLGENFAVQDWEGGFFDQTDSPKQSMLSTWIMKEENLESSWKGKEKAVQKEIEEESSVGLIMNA